MNAQRIIRRLFFLPLFLVLQVLFGAGPLPAQKNPFPPASPESKGIAQETIESLHHRIQGWIEEDRIVGGELLVIKNRQTVMHRAFGWNNREREEEMGVNTLFNIRSMTKPLVGTAVQILIQEGAPFRYSDAGANALGALIETVSGQPLDIFLESRLFGPLGMRDTGFLTQASGSDLPADRMAAIYGGTGGAWERFWEPSEDPFYPFPLGSQSVYATPMDYARFLTLWLDGGSSPGARLLSEESVRRTLTPASLMTRIGSTAPYPTAFPSLEVWHGQMAVLYLNVDGQGGAAPKIIGYAGSDGTFAWAWPQEDLVLVQAGALAVDIPGQMIFTLTEPDEEGWRSFTLTDLIAVNFQERASGKVEAMRLAQTSAFPRRSSPVGAMEAVPDSLRPLLGDFELPAGQGVITVTWEEGVLTVTDPRGMLTPLAETDRPGVWETDEELPKRITFSTDPAGEVTAMAWREIVILPRAESEVLRGKGSIQTSFTFLTSNR